MASRSSSSSSSSALVTSQRRRKNYYDVSVSFRGEDTRNNFSDHLFGALHRKGIVTFRDDTKLKKGEYVSSGLLQAIERNWQKLLIALKCKDKLF
ncbi:hypothetical protein TSUD_90020 [Trifolium subterraneum]|uniref:ADP-ribosyl cyclase/cyclic ADP-ribose hydrolase n=1 Tax=Trifolium subterraneum TaxID=3900 RepID=A0A2Z6P945_TRISU|nr:hypothetical protein TSUD_90020 [Trifolium subterraneum]